MRSPLGLKSKAATYTTLVGVAVGMTLTGLALPFVVGDTVSGVLEATTDIDTGPLPESGELAGPSATPETGPDKAGGSAHGDVAGTEREAAPAPQSSDAGEGGTSPTEAASGEVSLGVLLLDLGGVNSIGFQAPGASAETEREAFDAYIGLVNDSGGINGRRVVPYYAKFDPLRSETQDAACVAMAQDAKAFAVIAGAGYSVQHTLCLTERFGIPTMSFQAEAEQWQTRSKGLLLTKLMSTHRSVRALAQRAHDQGRLRERTIGIVTSESEPELLAVREALVPALDRLGYQVAHTAVLPGEPERGAQRMPVEIVQMRQKNVDLVIFISNPVYFATWISQADSQGFRPFYITSDAGASSEDFAVQQAPATLRAIAYTGQRTGEYHADLPEPAVDADCHRRYRERTGKPLDRAEEGGYHTIVRACGWVDLFAAAARRSGPSLTRSSYLSALQSIGAFDYPYNGPSSVQAGKLGLADAIRTKQYGPQCKCWVPIDDFVEAAP